MKLTNTTYQTQNWTLFLWFLRWSLFDAINIQDLCFHFMFKPLAVINEIQKFLRLLFKKKKNKSTYFLIFLCFYLMPFDKLMKTMLLSNTEQKNRTTLLTYC